jgi:serine phosphatase RsbU (regulator of sigma subunit)
MAAFASMLMVIPRFKSAMKYHEAAMKIRGGQGDEWGVGQSLQWLAYCHAWQGDYPKSDAYFNKSLAIYRRIGDIWEIGMCLGGLSFNAYMTSQYEQCQSLAREYQAISSKLNDYYGVARAYQHYAVCYIEKGDYKTAEEYLNDAEDLCFKNELAFNLCFNYGARGYFYLENGDYSDALECFEKAIELEKKNNFLKNFIIWIYPLFAEAYLRHVLAMNDAALVVSDRERNRVEEHVVRAMKKTRPWINAYALALRVAAMHHSAAGNVKKSEQYFTESIGLSAKCGKKFDTASTLHEFALFLQMRGRADEAMLKFEASYRIFIEIGAESRVRKLSRIVSGNTEKTPDREVISYLDQQRLASILKIGRDISSILDLDVLLKKVLQNAVEVTGAQRGFLFLKNESSPSADLAASTGIGSDSVDMFSRSIVDLVIHKGKPVMTSDAEHEQGYSLYRSVVRYGLKSILCVPLQRRSEILGACYLDNSLSSGVFSDEDRDILNVYMTQAAIAIDNARFYTNLGRKIDERTVELNSARKELEKAYSSVSNAFEIIKEDLSVARKIQQNMLPRALDAIEGVSIELMYRPVGDIGGDICDIVELRKGLVRVFVADATGHGIQASLLTMVIMSEYNKLKLKLDRPEDILRNLNDYFTGLDSLELVFSCVIADIDVNGKSVVYSSAGHPAQYILGPGGLVEMNTRGRIVGFVAHSLYASQRYEFQAGDCVLFMTDGVYERFDEKGRRYGEERMKKILGGMTSVRDQGIYQAINDDAVSFLGEKTAYDDDMTLIGITVT